MKNSLLKYEILTSLKHNDLIFFFIFIVLIFVIIKFIISIGFINFIWKYTFNLQKKIEKITFSLILEKKYNFFVQTPKGSLISFCKEETARSIEVIRSFILGLVEVGALFIIVIILLFIFPVASISILIFLTFVSFIFAIIIRRLSIGLSVKRSDYHSRVIKLLNESFLAIKEIKFNNLYDLASKKFDNLNNNLLKVDTKSLILVTLPLIFFEFLLLISAVFIMFIFVLSDFEKSLMISYLTIFHYALIDYFCFSRIHVNYQSIRLRFNSLETIFKFINLLKNK